jgi:hypothetical protein
LWSVWIAEGKTIVRSLEECIGGLFRSKELIIPVKLNDRSCLDLALIP